LDTIELQNTLCTKVDKYVSSLPRAKAIACHDLILVFESRAGEQTRKHVALVCEGVFSSGPHSGAQSFAMLGLPDGAALSNIEIGIVLRARYVEAPTTLTHGYALFASVSSGVVFEHMDSDQLTALVVSFDSFPAESVRVHRLRCSPAESDKWLVSSIDYDVVVVESADKKVLGIFG